MLYINTKTNIVFSSECKVVGAFIEEVPQKSNKGGKNTKGREGKTKTQPNEKAEKEVKA